MLNITTIRFQNSDKSKEKCLNNQLSYSCFHYLKAIGPDAIR